MITVKVKIKRLHRRGRPKTVKMPYDMLLKMISRADGKGVDLVNGKPNRYIKGNMVIVFP